MIGPVPSVDQALDLIEDHRLDGAVLDINLGDGDTSYPVADRLDVLRVPYLFATGEVLKATAGGHSAPPVLEEAVLQGRSATHVGRPPRRLSNGYAASGFDHTTGQMRLSNRTADSFLGRELSVLQLRLAFQKGLRRSRPLKRR